MKARRSRLLAGLLASLGVFLTQPVLATLYGTVGEGGTLSTLVEINPTTGALVRTIGPVGYGVNGLADGRDGTLYATTRGTDPLCPRGLLRINTTTGAGTPIGCGTAASGDRPALLASSASGQLYSWYEPGSDDLISWNKVSGTFSAPIGEAGLGTGSHTLAFDVAGTTLYLLEGSSLYTINPTTGASTSIGTIGGSTGSPHHGQFNPANGLLYAPSCSDCTGRDLLSINVLTRVQVGSVPLGAEVHALAFFGSSAPPATALPVPVDNKWALAVVAVLLAGFGLRYLKRT